MASSKKVVGDQGPSVLSVQYRRTSDLRPYEKNARTHSAEQVETIAKSISTFGWTNPILIDAEDGIIAGHGRLAAAKLLGLDEVPVLELSGLTDARKRAYILADNQLALNGGWDMEILTQEIAVLEASDIDMTLLGNLDLRKALTEPDGQTWKTPVIKFNLTFDDERQQQTWFQLVRRLKQEYPEMETLSARLSAFLKIHTSPEKKAA